MQLNSKPKTAQVYLLLRSEVIEIAGRRHYLRAWRVEKPTADYNYHFEKFMLTHSDCSGDIYRTQDFMGLDQMGETMGRLMHDLQVTFSDPCAS